MDNDVYKIVARIPKGKVLTYGLISKYLKSKGKNITPRQVGGILHKNPDPNKVPCHRVVKSTGVLAKGYAFGGMKTQRNKLENEEIIFSTTGKLDLMKHLFEIKG